MNDLLRYVWGKLIGRHKIAWRVSPDKTWEGFFGGLVSATALGTLLWWATPFTPLQSAGMSFTICILGFAGGLVISAIKPAIGIKDFAGGVGGPARIFTPLLSFFLPPPPLPHLLPSYF